MERNEIRLECLKLANSLSRGDAEIVGRAKKFEEYILGDTEEKTVEKVKKPSKKNGNSDLLG